MDITTLSGDTFITLNIDPLKEYKYNELKAIFKNIKSEKHFAIVQNNIKIYTDMFDIIHPINSLFLLSNPNIVFYSYSKEDTNKIYNKYNELPIYMNDNYNYVFNKNGTLKSEYLLSQDDLDKDETFMIYCMSIHGDFLCYASDELKKNTEIINYGYKSNPSVFKYVSKELLNDFNFMLSYPLAFEYVSEQLKDNYQFCLIMCQIFQFNFKYVSLRLKNCKKFVNKILSYNKWNKKNDYCNIIFYLDSLKSDKDIIMKILKLESLNSNYKYDSEIFNSIGNNLKTDMDIIKLCLKIDGTQLQFIPKEVILEKNIILSALNSCGSNISYLDDYHNILSHVSNIYRDDKEIVIKSIRRNGNNYFYASDRLKKDNEVIMEAINNCYTDIDNIAKAKRDAYDDIVRVNNIIRHIISKSGYKIDDLPNSISATYINKLNKYINVRTERY